MLPLGSSSSAYDRSLVEAFREGLRQVGLVENRDILLDVVWIGGDPDETVKQLIERGAELLIPCGSSASVAVKRQTSTIPIVFISVGNPVAMGLVDSLPRPGQNATGFADILADLGSKLVDLAREINRPREIVDYLWHSDWPDGLNRYRGTEQAAATAGVKLQSRAIADVNAIEDATKALKDGGASTLIIQPSPLTFQQRARIITTATRYGIGTIWGFPAAAREGGMIGPPHSPPLCGRKGSRRSRPSTSMRLCRRPILSRARQCRKCLFSKASASSEGLMWISSAPSRPPCVKPTMRL